jgi:hypothetical protein
MDFTNSILVASGIGCVFLTVFAMRRLIPREGRPASVWTNTDGRAATVALGLISLALVGTGLIARDLFG